MEDKVSIIIPVYYAEFGKFLCYTELRKKKPRQSGVSGTSELFCPEDHHRAHPMITEA